jgi:hypothetical protein
MQIFKSPEDMEKDEAFPFNEELSEEETEEEENSEPEEEDIDELEKIEEKIEKGEDVAISSLEAHGIPKSRIVYTCPKCKKIFLKGKWVKDTISDLYTIKPELAYCNKCIKKVYENYIGTVEIRAKDVKEHKEDYLELAREVERELEDPKPFEKIHKVEEREGVLIIRTNTTRLAQEIGKRLRLEFQGGIQYQWMERNQYLNVIWQDHVDNKNLLKERMRALRERRSGILSLEDEV